jgi:hypothetical protein
LHVRAHRGIGAREIARDQREGQKSRETVSDEDR